jgi:hypothetical protein
MDTILADRRAGFKMTSPDAYGLEREPPGGLPRYRLLTGKDDATFCNRVSEALKIGYELYGPPAITFNGVDVIAAQAVLWPIPAFNEVAYDDDIPF